MSSTQSKFVGNWNVVWVTNNQGTQSSGEYSMSITQDGSNLEGVISIPGLADQTTFGPVAVTPSGGEVYAGEWKSIAPGAASGTFQFILADNEPTAFGGYWSYSGGPQTYSWLGISASAPTTT